jgi:hypothetical protein
MPRKAAPPTNPVPAPHSSVPPGRSRGRPLVPTVPASSPPRSPVPAVCGRLPRATSPVPEAPKAPETVSSSNRSDVASSRTARPAAQETMDREAYAEVQRRFIELMS